MNAPVFPAAAPTDEPHPPGCACLPCIDALLAEVSRPLVLPAPRVDPALLVPPPRLRPDWRAPQALNDLDAVRGTRGPGGAGGRRPTGPGKRRGAGSVGGEGKPGGCPLALAVLAAGVVVGIVVLWGLAGLAYLLWQLATQ